MPATNGGGSAGSTPAPGPARSSTYNEDVVALAVPPAHTWDLRGSSAVGNVAAVDRERRRVAEEYARRDVKDHAVVIRCWADEQAPEAMAEAHRLGIHFQPLQPGELEVLHPSGLHEILLESDTTVVDRGFLVGDLVRQSAHPHGQAGIVTSLSTRVTLLRVLDGEVLEGWFDAKDLVAPARIGRGDHVVFEQWVGVVEEVFEMAMVESGDSDGLKRVCDTGASLQVGATTENLLLDRAIFPTVSDLKRVIDVRQIVVAVNWLCMSQQRSSSTSSSTSRPKRYWTDFDSLSLVRSTADHLHSVGDKVVFRDPTRSPAPPPSITHPSYISGYRVFVVTNTRSTADVLFQDGTTLTAPTPDFEHCLNLDEDVDVFPGDVGVFAGPPPRVGIVQRMDARRRTVRIRYFGTQEEETVSGLEFDPHGPPPEVFGVRRGDHVLIAGEKEGNGADVPTVPRLGESETLTGAFPSPETLRIEMSAIGLDRVSKLGDAPPALPKTGAQTTDINWYGEVASLLLDGRVLVRYPSGVEEAVDLRRIYHLDDGMDGVLGPAFPGDEGMDGVSDDGHASENSWETEGSIGDEDAMDVADEDQVVGWAEQDDEDEPVKVDEIVVDRKEDKVVVGAEKQDVAPRLPGEVEEDESWRRFVVLEEAPKDHHYVKEPTVNPSKAFMARVKKEYSVLASSLPPNILVRAYEDRADLLRCLIIGPLGTPFQNAPFLFDMYLPPTRFPQEPPSIFFHSWAGGTRVSPNLYAEGKVCLSLLGTWSGDKMESWSAARSSILQIFISIQSLIMVEQPYYTEPGFEKQVSTLEGQAASDLYNERTYVLTRAFVKRACEYPPSDFETETKAYYFTGLPTTGPGALRGVVEQAKLALEESEAYLKTEAGMNEEKGEKERPRSVVLPEMRVLTEGACLSLKRTLKGLETLLSNTP